MVKNKLFWHKPVGLLLAAILSFGLAFLVFLRATDTGSLQQYAIMFVLVFFGLDRLIRIFRVVRHAKTAAS